MSIDIICPTPEAAEALSREWYALSRASRDKDDVTTHAWSWTTDEKTGVTTLHVDDADLPVAKAMTPECKAAFAVVAKSSQAVDRLALVAVPGAKVAGAAVIAEVHATKVAASLPEAEAVKA